MQTKFKNFGIMLDCSRNAVRTVESLKKFITYISKMGYNMLQLYTEDTFEITDEKYFGYLRGRYSKEELKELNEYAKSQNVTLVPCIQTLAHLNQIFRWERFSEVNDVRDILLCGDEKTYELIDKMFATLRECFTTDIVNIGMDEAQLVGLGKYLREHGFQERFSIILNHLTRVNEIAKKYGFKPLMWSDMFFKLANNTTKYYTDKLVEFPQEVIDKVPEDVSLVYWDYYQTDEKKYDIMMQSHKQFKNDIWFAGGCWIWATFAPHNRFAIKACKASMKMAIKNGIENVFITLWGDDGAECSYMASLPCLYYASCLAKGITKVSEIKKGFKEMFGVDFDKFMYLDLPDEIGPREDKIVTPSKYALYSDLFMGFLDGSISTEQKQEFKSHSKKLALCSKIPEFGYLFESQKALCDVCYIKADLGVKTRKFYKENNKEELKNLIKEYTQLIKKLEIFYDKFKTLWFKENKPHGFDIQDIRLGGLMQRVKSCKTRLQDYLSGKIDKIEELDEELIPVKNEILNYRIYYRIVSPNVLEYR